MCFECDHVLSKRTGKYPKAIIPHTSVGGQRADVAGTAPPKTYHIAPHNSFILFKAFLKFSVTVRKRTGSIVVENAISACERQEFFTDGYFYGRYCAVLT